MITAICLKRRGRSEFKTKPECNYQYANAAFKLCALLFHCNSQILELLKSKYEIIAVNLGKISDGRAGGI